MKYSCIYKYGYGYDIAKYRPYIQYKWNTSIDSTGNKVLLDNGVVPKFNATLYSGRGVKFNGVDQSVASTFGELGMSEHPEKFTIIIDAIPTNSKIILNTGYSSSTNGITLYVSGNTLVLSANSNENSSLSGSFSGQGTVVITFDNNVFSLYANGEIIANRELIYSSPIWFRQTESFSLGAYRNSSSFFEGTLDNAILIDRIALSPTEIKYQYNYPEKFLYHEKQTDGTFVAKSKILTQDKIDSVVAHFPMCETDGFVRNMIGYSEEANIVTDISFVDWGSAGDGTVTDNGDGSFTVEVTTATDSQTYPRLDMNQLHDRLVGETYRYDVSVESIDGNSPDTIAVYDGSLFILGSGVGDFTKVSTCTSSRTEGHFYLDGQTLWKIKITMSEKKLTSTYPIENYTNATRDNAKNLTTGLQTCFWKRDVLGVPVGSSFDGIRNDTEIESVVIPHMKYELGVGYHLIEGVFEYYKDNTYVKIATTYNGFGITKYFDNFLRLYITRDGNEYFVVPTTVAEPKLVKNTKYHFTVEIVDNGSSVTAQFSLNGELCDSVSEDYTDYDVEAISGLLSSSNVVAPAGLFLFNIHTTPQDPAKLYADAVKKGLVPEQLQST